MIQFLIIAGAIFVVGPLHHEGGAKAIHSIPSAKTTIVKAWHEAEPLVPDRTGNYGND